MWTRIKPFGALAAKTSGIFEETDTGGFTVRQGQGDDSLTVAIVGATGVWRRLNALPLLTPVDAVLSREFSVASDGCNLDAEGGMGRLKKKENIAGIVLHFDDEEIHLGDNCL